jgi:hypothetical protein
MTIAESQLLYSDTRGLSIPWVFATDILEGSIIGGKKEWEHLKDICNPHEKWEEAERESGYWGAWHDVLMNVILKDDKGKVYSLHQDGDVFLVPHSKHVKWIPDEDEVISYGALDDMYKGFLDEIHGTVKICGYEYSSSRALGEVDPTAYRCGFADWLDSQVKDESLYEYDDEYSNKDITEPDEFTDWFLGDTQDKHGHYEWKDSEVIAMEEKNRAAMNESWEPEFESDIPAHQTMENH